MQVSHLIVGAGLTGAVFARCLTDAGHSVLVVDRRSHIGGNVHDRLHESGIRVQTYGPHYFRTVSDEIWRFVNRFAAFYRYEACVKCHVDGSCENWPIAASYIRRVVGDHWEPEFKGRPANFEEAALSLMPRRIYETFVKEYTEKQWGVPASQLSADLCRRFDVRPDDDPRLTPRAKYQGIPAEGYAKMVERMLQGIPVVLDFDYLGNRDAYRPRRMTVFTGPIDEFFGFSLGKLKYRGQQRTTRYFPDLDRAQPAGQVNEPLHSGGAHIRTLEWKHFMKPSAPSRVRGTVITQEVPITPRNPENYEYPFPDDTNRDLYRDYRTLANELGDVLICGRLGEYKYYDMDHAIARALTLVKRVLDGKTPAQITRGDSEVGNLAEDTSRRCFGRLASAMPVHK